MLVYTGKLNYDSYARNEIITVIFGGEATTVNEPVVATWQWTENAAGEKKANSPSFGSLNEVKYVSYAEREVTFFKKEAEQTYYWFQGRVTSSGLTLNMYNRAGDLCVENITLKPTYPFA
ncbi:hypothetical protein BDV39DRAFT_201142 [Aspergillus sergii]|uniref:Uncharacterized protein n=1 Tax=Aspergillus sergii TaxID=1034303 RepID=A0A5N6XFH7_9EURO|nr:hypothetical protein BDV39DRAFT_201142 [Aspergillus sergii]